MKKIFSKIHLFPVFISSSEGQNEIAKLFRFSRAKTKQRSDTERLATHLCERSEFYRNTPPLGTRMTFILLLAVFGSLCIKFSFFDFTVSQDSISYMETARLFLGEPATVFPERILKPLAPLGISALSFFTQGDIKEAFILEAVFFYVLFGIVSYFFLFLFFEKKSSVLLGSLLLIFAYPALKYGLDLYTETGAWFFLILAYANIISFYKNPNKRNFYLSLAVIDIGLLWKEYSILAAVFLGLIILFHPLLSRKEKTRKLMQAGAIVGGIIIAVQIVTYLKFHFTYLDWFRIGRTVAKSEAHYTVFFFLKSTFAVFLLGWGLVALGLKNWRSFLPDEKRIVLCLIPPSFMFLLWGSVSSRLSFVIAPLLAILAVKGLEQIKSDWWKITTTALVITGNWWWLFANDTFRHFLNAL